MELQLSQSWAREALRGLFTATGCWLAVIPRPHCLWHARGSLAPRPSLRSAPVAFGSPFGWWGRFLLSRQTQLPTRGLGRESGACFWGPHVWVSVLLPTAPGSPGPRRLCHCQGTHPPLTWPGLSQVVPPLPSPAVPSRRWASALPEVPEAGFDPQGPPPVQQGHPAPDQAQHPAPGGGRRSRSRLGPWTPVPLQAWKQAAWGGVGWDQSLGSAQGRPPLFLLLLLLPLRQAGKQAPALGQGVLCSQCRARLGLCSVTSPWVPGRRQDPGAL